MNKLLLLFALTFAVVYCEDKNSSEEKSSSEEKLEKVAEYLQTKLNITIIKDIYRLAVETNKNCPDLEDKFDETMDEVANCLDSIELGSDTLCDLIRKNLIRCAEPARKVVAGCLPEESKSIPGFVIKVIHSILDQACNSTVEEILELFNPCTLEKEFASVESCSNIKDALVEHRNKLPSRSLLCELIPKVKQCVKTHQEASCKNPITKRSLLNFHEAVEEGTVKECEKENEA